MNHFTRPSWVVPTFLPLVFATDIAGTMELFLAVQLTRSGGIAEAIFRGQEQKKDKRMRLYAKSQAQNPVSTQEEGRAQLMSNLMNQNLMLV